VLKKQLHQLSVKFDELRSAKSVLSEGGPSPGIQTYLFTLLYVEPTLHWCLYLTHSHLTHTTFNSLTVHTEYVISDLKVQLVTTSQQLSNASEESKLLKIGLNISMYILQTRFETHELYVTSTYYILHFNKYQSRRVYMTR
jgi:hypothetical protein